MPGLLENYGDYSYSSSSHMSPVHNSEESQFSLTPAMFQVLLALGDEEKHGYAILKDVEDQTGGHLGVRPAPVYPMVQTVPGEGSPKGRPNLPPAAEES